MSFKVLKILIAFAFCIIGFTTCKKYPEDGKFSGETVRERITNKWELKECLVNNVDMIDKQNTFKYINPENQSNDSVVYTLRNFLLEVKYYIVRTNGKRTKKYDVDYSVSNVLYSNTCICSGIEWRLIDHKKKLMFNIGFKKGFGYGPNTVYLHLLYNETNEAWDIKKLTNKELIIETINSDNKKVRLKFNSL